VGHWLAATEVVPLPPERHLRRRRLPGRPGCRRLAIDCSSNCGDAGDKADKRGRKARTKQRGNGAAAAAVASGDSEPEAKPELSDADCKAEIQRLAKLSPIQYERQREAAAAGLTMRATMVDRLVTPRAATASKAEPWPCRNLRPAGTGAMSSPSVTGGASGASLIRASRTA
jgi:hypothetical protein